MCGIAGKINLKPGEPVNPDLIHGMLDAIHHRGPDGRGVFSNDYVGLGNARLSIIDLSGGNQPISNEDGTVWIVFNGEIYNYLELRSELEASGHIFRTNSDTEVIVHLYEEKGTDCLLELNGQFAIALWNQRQNSLLLARDRLGVRPIYYTTSGESLVFASEAKALFAYPGIKAEIDPISLAQVFTFWTTLNARSSFRNIKSVPPGHFIVIKNGEITLSRYWGLDMTVSHQVHLSLDEAADHLRYLLGDAVRLRLRSDVPVGAYLSGGLDSSTITALTRQHAETNLKTFSIAFHDHAFDESPYQDRVNKFLNVENCQIRCTPAEIAAAFPNVVFHAEMPLLRTAPVPMFLLSRLVHTHGFKVVLTGEGSDETLGGYDIYKEAKIRRFWSRQPDSQLRPLLLHRLYPYISNMAYGKDAYLKAFFGQGLTRVEDPFYSHRLRWQNTTRCWRFFSPEIQSEIKGYDPLADLSETLPYEFNSWHPFAQAQYLEITIFLSEYLLSSQGDRMGMANSVEGRYPFLDPRVVDYSARLPVHYKMLGLREKLILKRAVQGLLLPETIQRFKQPYRAPIKSVFFGEQSPEYVEDCLSLKKLQDTGYFNPVTVAALSAKFRRGGQVSETEEMALVGILSVQLLHSMWRS